MILAALREIVGAAHATDAVEPRYLTDETGGRSGRPIAMVRPADTAEVSAVLALCDARAAPVVVQGGRTGMTRATLPADGEVILSLERLRAIEAIDPVVGTMTLGAAVPLSVAQDAARDAGWHLAIDIGARDSCTIGGMIATNAGGHEVLRHGMMRAQVLGLEAVLADGTIISSMRGLPKDNSGYDLAQWLIGSEGTLGVVTRAILRLRSPASAVQTALCALPDDRAAADLLRLLQAATGDRVSAFEGMWPGYLAAASGVLATPLPFAMPGAAVLIETEGDEAALVDGLGRALDEGLVADAVFARSIADRTGLWRWREAIGPLVARMTIVEPFDVGLPCEAIPATVAALDAALSAAIPDCAALFFGHLGDGNLHLALGLPDEESRAVAERIVYDAVRDARGSVSAEHGIGMLKRAWLGHTRSPAEIALMRRIRAAFDPRAILNRGRIF